MAFVVAVWGEVGDQLINGKRRAADRNSVRSDAARRQTAEALASRLLTDLRSIEMRQVLIAAVAAVGLGLAGTSASMAAPVNGWVIGHAAGNGQFEQVHWRWGWRHHHHHRFFFHHHHRRWW
jgi:hypothetical protein